VQAVEEVEDADHDNNPPTDQPVVDDVAAAEALLELQAHPPNPSPQPKQTDGQYKHHGGGSHHH